MNTLTYSTVNFILVIIIIIVIFFFTKFNEPMKEWLTLISSYNSTKILLVNKLLFCNITYMFKDKEHETGRLSIILKTKSSPPLSIWYDIKSWSSNFYCFIIFARRWHYETIIIGRWLILKTIVLLAKRSTKWRKNVKTLRT